MTTIVIIRHTSKSAEVAGVFTAITFICRRESIANSRMRAMVLFVKTLFCQVMLVRFGTYQLGKYSNSNIVRIHYSKKRSAHVPSRKRILFWRTIKANSLEIEISRDEIFKRIGLTSLFGFGQRLQLCP